MRQRLDVIMALQGIASSRARDLIKRGEVLVDGKVVTKAGKLVADGCELKISKGANRYDARSGEKLATALEHFAFSVEGRVVLDIGASTGGFTQVLLERGARHVFAVDVGRDQLHQDIKNDPRVSDMPGSDARKLKVSDFAQTFSVIAADVSFISLRKVLPSALSLVVLVKPQFELARDVLGKGGIVKDEGACLMAVKLVSDYLCDVGWNVKECVSSPFPGKRGNLGSRWG